MRLGRWFSRALAIAGVLALSSGSVGHAQYIYCDSNGDGRRGQVEGMSPSSTTIAVWLQTDRNRDGTLPKNTVSNIARTIFSYEICLRASGGTVAWGKWINSQPTMSSCNFRRESDTELYIVQCGLSTDGLAPGRYELGRIEVTSLSGDPLVEFSHASTLFPGGTSFGSMYPGRDMDHTVKLGDSRAAEVYARGDFTDSDGLRASSSSGAFTHSGTSPRFSAALIGGSVTNPKLRITTTKTGILDVRLYDVQGRLVLTPARGVASAGTRELPLQNGKLASGVYMYHVKATEGSKTGRVLLIR